MTVTDALKDRLTACDPQDETPLKSPAGDYVIIRTRAPLDGPRRHAGAPSGDTIDVTVVAVSRSKDGCRAIGHRARAVLDDWRPVSHAACSPLRRIDTGPVQLDGPEGDRRYSQVVIYRCTIPRNHPI